MFKLRHFFHRRRTPYRKIIRYANPNLYIHIGVTLCGGENYCYTYGISFIDYSRFSQEVYKTVNNEEEYKKAIANAIETMIKQKNENIAAKIQKERLGKLNKQISHEIYTFDS